MSRATYIILGEQVERAEHFVVLDVKRPRGLEVALEGDEIWGLDVELFGRANLAELLMLGSRDPGCPPRSAAVVVVRVGVEVLLMVLRTVVEKLGHDYRLWLWWMVGWLTGGAVRGEPVEAVRVPTTTKTKQRGSRFRGCRCKSGRGVQQEQRWRGGRRVVLSWREMRCEAE